MGNSFSAHAQLKQSRFNSRKTVQPLAEVSEDNAETKESMEIEKNCFVEVKY